MIIVLKCGTRAVKARAAGLEQLERLEQSFLQQQAVQAELVSHSLEMQARGRWIPADPHNKRLQSFALANFEVNPG